MANEDEEPAFLIRRSDTGPETIAITGRAVVDFDLNPPPNQPVCLDLAMCDTHEPG